MAYRDMFSDLYVDFLATTGYNLEGAHNKIMNQYDGWHKSNYQEFSHYAGSVFNPVTVKHKNFYQFQKHNNPDGLGGFNDEFTQGVGSRVSLDASQQFLLQRMQSDQTGYDKYMQETLESKSKFDTLSQAMEQQDIGFLEAEANLIALRGQMQESGSTSSVGAYSQAARRQMEGNRRYINTLDAFTAPTKMQMDPYFVDPLTGERRHTREDFDEAAARNAFQTQEDVLGFVTDTYNTRRQELETSLFEQAASQAGVSSELVNIIDPTSDIRRLYDSTQEWLSNNPTGHYDRPRRSWDIVGSGDNAITYGYYTSMQDAVNAFDPIKRFAEARSLAEMMGNTEGYWSETYQGEDTAITGTQAIQRALTNNDFSIEEILQDTSEDTFNRFSIQNINNMQNVMQEFDRRKNLATQQVANIDLRNRLSQERQETILAQRRKAQQLFEQQQQEYASTLAGVGAQDTDFSGNILFTATRPQ